MDGERPGAMNDPTLDREIAGALNVEPSPEFVARVRLRVASEPAAPAWRGWRLVLAGATAAVVAVMVVSGARDEVDPPRTAIQQAAPPAAADMSPTLAAGPREQGVRAPSASAEAAVSRRAALAAGAGAVSRSRGDDRSSRPELPPPRPLVIAADRAEPPPFPEVIVSPDEVRAFEMLLGIAREQGLPPLPQDAAARSSETVDVPDLQFVPLVIEPLPQIARLEEGERQ